MIPKCTQHDSKCLQNDPKVSIKRPTNVHNKTPKCLQNDSPGAKRNRFCSSLGAKPLLLGVSRGMGETGVACEPNLEIQGTLVAAMYIWRYLYLYTYIYRLNLAAFELLTCCLLGSTRARLPNDKHTVSTFRISTRSWRWPSLALTTVLAD